MASSGQDHRSRPRPGGRSARVRAAVLTAALDELVESGYPALTIPAVARRAGVHESSIYRRWGGRSALVAEACREAARASVAVPDSGSLRKDLLALLQRVAAMWRSPVGRAMMQLTVAAEGDGELLAEIRRFWGERFALVGELFTRARVRGEWPAGADESLLLEALLGALLVRMHLSHRPTGAGWLQRLVDAMLPDPANGKQAKRNERRKQA